MYTSEKLNIYRVKLFWGFLGCKKLIRKDKSYGGALPFFFFFATAILKYSIIYHMFWKLFQIFPRDWNLIRIHHLATKSCLWKLTKHSVMLAPHIFEIFHIQQVNQKKALIDRIRFKEKYIFIRKCLLLSKYYFLSHPMFWATANTLHPFVTCFFCW